MLALLCVEECGSDAVGRSRAAVLGEAALVRESLRPPAFYLKGLEIEVTCRTPQENPETPHWSPKRRARRRCGVGASVVAFTFVAESVGARRRDMTSVLYS